MVICGAISLDGFPWSETSDRRSVDDGIGNGGGLGTEADDADDAADGFDMAVVGGVVESGEDVAGNMASVTQVRPVRRARSNRMKGQKTSMPTSERRS